jgi:hypothetical protein
MNKLIFIPLAFILCSCAGWQKTTHKSLLTAHQVAVQARIAMADICAEKINICIAENNQACPALSKCQTAVNVLDSTNRSISVGLDAIDKGDESAASHALQVVLSAILQVRQILAGWGISI